MKNPPIKAVTIAIFWAGVIALGLLGVLGPIFRAGIFLGEVAIVSFVVWYAGIWIGFGVRATLEIPEPSQKVDRSVETYGCVCVVVLVLALLARRFLGI